MKKVLLKYLGLTSLSFLSIAQGHAATSKTPSHIHKNLAVVMMYHRIQEDTGSMSLSLNVFNQQMAYIHDNGYHVIPSMDLVNALQSHRPLPPKSIVLTFDDGWISQRDAIKTLRQYGYPATFALITGVSSQGRKAYLGLQDIESNEDNNFTFVNHSTTHELKDFLDHPEKDVPLSKSQLLSIEPNFTPIYIYPFGKSNPALKAELAKSGYIAEFGVWDTPVSVNSNIHNIPRYLMNYKVDMLVFKNILSHVD